MRDTFSPKSPRNPSGKNKKRLTQFFLLFFSLALIGLIQTQASEEVQRNTVFLPLKVNSATDQKTLTELGDQALQDALKTTEIRRKNFYLMPRSEAQKKFDYQASWPPPVDILQKTVVAGRKNIVAGSITRLGKKISIDLKLYDLLDPSSPEYFFLEVEDLKKLDKSLDQLVDDILARTAREFLLASVSVKGNERIDSGAIMHQLKSQAGDVYNPEALRSDLKSIFKMGYFDDVRINLSDTKNGKEITFEVKEKPVIGQILINGSDKLKEETIREAIPLAINTILNPQKLKEAESNIQALYKEKGFYNTEVSSTLTYPKPEIVDINFSIMEGHKAYIKEIKIIGNNSFKDRKLTKVIKTSEKGIFSWFTDSGVLKRDILEQDAARIAAFYHNQGYIDAKVGAPEITQDGKWLYVTFNISEGDRYRVGTIDIVGDLIEEKETLLGLVKLREEEFLSRKILREDISRLSDFYAEKGYAFSDVTPKVDESTTEKKVDIVLNILKGDLVYLDRITIKGNSRTRDKVIRRELDIKEGGLFNSKGIRTSQNKLRRLDFFEDINITPQPTQEKDLMNVLVEVKEKPTGAFSIGAGYSSVDNVMLMGEISQNNFLGKGQRLALQASISSTSNKYNLSFTEPHLNDSKLSVGFDLFNWEKEYDDYTKESQGGGMRFGYPIWELWKMGFGFGHENADLTDVEDTAAQEIKDSVDIHVTNYITLGLSRDTRDFPMDPSKGSINSINTEYAGGLLGGDSAFTKIEGITSWFFPFPLDTTFHFKGSAGQLFENYGGELPVYEKFYLGGINSIRGFTSSHISPQDPATQERIGGSKMWYINTEWIFPLAKEAGIKSLIFFDAGNVYGDDWDFSQIKKSVGTGFRWLSPMGPLRLEWGYVINPADDEDQSNWDFSIGGAF